ncbi:MAG: hypothetical protein KA509_00540 [Flavobacterium sp.]|jgi:hypothetical protein|nr:hypothetical protein [Flavobacterium sp.]
MKNGILLLVTFVSIFFSSCEKDDICDANTITTPRLVLTFYDSNNPSVLKNVNQLKVVGEGMTEGIVFSPTAIGDSKYVTNASTISLPLKVDQDVTTYHLTFNSGNSNAAVVFTDKIRINYTRKNTFVSRACGYKTTFDLQPSNPIIHTATPSSSAKWIQYISVEKTNIENENETHLKLFF